MKKIKSFVCFLLALAMVLTLALPTFAQTATEMKEEVESDTATDGESTTNVKNILAEIVWEDEVYPGHAPFEFKVTSSTDEDYTVTLSEENQWQGMIADLPVLDSDGNEITYTTRNEIPGYTITEETELSGSTEIRRIICRIDSDRGTVTIPVEKVWDADVPAEDIVPVEVDLYVAVGNGDSSSQVMLLSTLTLDESNHWTAAFTGFPRQTRTSYYVSERETNTVAQYSEPRVKLRVGPDDRTIYAAQPKILSDDLFYGFDVDENPAGAWYQDTGGDEFFPNDASDPYIKDGKLMMPGSANYNTSMKYWPKDFYIEPTDYFEIAFVPYVWQSYGQSPMTFLICVDGVRDSYTMDTIYPFDNENYLVFTTEALGLSGHVDWIGIYVEGYWLRATIGVDYMYLGSDDMGADAVYEKLTITGRGSAPELDENLYLADVNKGKITIKNDEIPHISAKTFEAYRILDMKIYRNVSNPGKDEIACITYTVPDYLVDFYADRYSLDKNAWNFAENVKTAIAEEPDKAQFLDDIMELAVTSKVYSGSGSGTTYVITDLPLGYYVVKDTTLQWIYVDPVISPMLVITDPEGIAYADTFEEEEAPAYPTDPVSALYFEFDTNEDPAADWVRFAENGSLHRDQPYINGGYLTMFSYSEHSIDIEYLKETNYIIQPEDHFEIALKKKINSFMDEMLIGGDFVLLLEVDGVLHEITVGEVIPLSGKQTFLTEPLGLSGHVEKIGLSCGGVSYTAANISIDYMYLGSENKVDSTVTIGHTLNLAENIVLNYIVPATQLEGYDMDTAYLEVMLAEYKDNTYCGSTTYTLLPELRGEHYYFVMEGLTAVRMNDELRATLYMTKDGQNFCSLRDTYSIAEYAYNQMRKKDASAELKTLCADLLVYGAKAQIFKGYRTGFLPNEDMTYAEEKYCTDLATITFGNNEVIGNELEAPTVTWVGKAMDLNARVAMIYCVDLSDYTGDPADLTMKVRYVDCEGQEKTVVLTDPTPYPANENCYSFYMDCLLATELRTVLTAQVYVGDRAVSNTLTYSPDTYGNNKLGALGELCKALFAYSDSAKAYFVS